MSDTRTHENQAEEHRAAAEAILASLPTPVNAADKLAMAQCHLLEAMISALLAETAKGPAAPTATPLR